MSLEGKCVVCGKPAGKICSACKKVSYCSVEHQRSHWKSGHKSNCKVYLLKKNDVMGRYIVAAKDIPAGSVIMDEPALVIGPKQDTLPICFGCHVRVDGSYLCSKCGVPVCNVECEQAKIHAENECQIFQKKNSIKITDYNKHHPMYQCIMTLRCLLMRDRDKARWDLLNTMEHHNSIRKDMTALWTRNEVNTVKFLREVYKMDFDPETIHSVLGYADINAFEIKAQGVAICGMFPEVALMAHDCISNTHHSITKDYRMIVRNTIPIKKGEMITTTYTYTLEGTLDRRVHISTSKLFSCTCARCTSPTEMGSNFSTVKCFSCPESSSGYLTPINPLNPESVWECDLCHRKELVEAIQATVSEIRGEIAEIEGRNTNTKTIIPDLESVLQKYSGKRLHPQHFLMVGVIYSLSQFYGGMKDYMMDELNLEQLRRKEELCRLLLKVLDIIEPGLSRVRGMTLFELHAAVFFSTQISFKNGDMDKYELNRRLEAVVELLNKSKEILGFDCPSSNLGKIAASIPEKLKGVKQILEHFCGADGIKSS